jgi:hypothetical protein
MVVGWLVGVLDADFFSDVTRPSPEAVHHERKVQHEAGACTADLAKSLADMAKHFDLFAERLGVLELQNHELRARNQLLQDELHAQSKRIQQMQDHILALALRSPAPVTNNNNNVTNNINIRINVSGPCKPDLGHMLAERMQQLFMQDPAGLPGLLRHGKSAHKLRAWRRGLLQDNLHARPHSIRKSAQQRRTHTRSGGHVQDIAVLD